ncbi:tail fiber protein [Photorhabdus viridis]|uniref:tail fiber protein n=1 Tax=Photorhabdus viridis TaxID=3163327 RepID=UPI0033073FF2
MFGLDNPSGVSVMPPITPASNPTPLWFTEGGAGLAVSYPGQEWFNIVQAELLAVLQEAGIKPDKNKLNQLAVAIKSIAAERGIELTDKLGNSSVLAASQKLVSEVNDNANNKLAKNQNGADIPDKNAFIKNLGLVETVNKANNAFPKTGGDIYGQIALKGDKRLGYYITDNDGQIRAAIYKDKGGNLILTNGYDGGGLFIIRRDGALSFGNAASAITGDGNIYGNTWSVGGGVPGYLHDYLDRLAPAGVPLPYPHRYTPAGYLTCNGQTFDKSLYPKLAEAYPAGRVPDLRGEFIRGWDDSRGVDPGRVCGTWQAGANESHSHIMPTGRMPVNVDSTSKTWVVVENDVSSTKVSTYSSGANETRPRNVAFNYIVRAA